jgi:hypothetical protein
MTAASTTGMDGLNPQLLHCRATPKVTQRDTHGILSSRPALRRSASVAVSPCARRASVGGNAQRGDLQNRPAWWVL